MELLNLIKGKTFSEVKELLSSAPYFINVAEEGNLYLLKYNQIESPKADPIVKECRGIILEKETNKIVCYPFNRFFNFEEICADAIDWTSAKILTKVDGSIMKKYYYDGTWKVATNGTINAYNATTAIGKSFGEIFDEAWAKTGAKDEDLNKDYTYIFELVSPYNRVVVPYDTTKLFYLGARDNTTLNELDLNIGIEKPKAYSFTSLEDCVATAKALPYSEEGYVVVDKYWNRIKIKSPAYLTAHSMVNNHIVTKEKIIEMIVSDSADEFVSYFKEYAEDFDKIKDKLFAFVDEVVAVYEKEFFAISWASKKDYAVKATGYKFANILFALYDGKLTKDKIKDAVYKMSADKLLRMIGED